jgi:hypothetical protein
LVPPLGLLSRVWNATDVRHFRLYLIWQEVEPKSDPIDDITNYRHETDRIEHGFSIIPFTKIVAKRNSARPPANKWNHLGSLGSSADPFPMFGDLFSGLHRLGLF